MDKFDISSVVQGIFGAGFLALVGGLLSSRSGRQRDFDARVDADNDELREEVRTLREARDRAVTERDDARYQVARLRRLCASRGIDPDDAL